MADVFVLNPPVVKDFCRSARWAARSRGRVQRLTQSKARVSSPVLAPEHPRMISFMEDRTEIVGL